MDGQSTEGWVVSVLIEVDRAPQRRFFAVAQPDRARAEWSAIDCAMLEGPLVSSPVNGLEPVEAVAPLAAAALKSTGVTPGRAKPLGPRWPRRLIGSPTVERQVD